MHFESGGDGAAERLKDLQPNDKMVRRPAEIAIILMIRQVIRGTVRGADKAQDSTDLEQRRKAVGSRQQAVGSRGGLGFRVRLAQARRAVEKRAKLMMNQTN
ncbi:MAG TPA: hypothetical protein VKM94_25035, partial [Blastocatellia bacterium]|nr:hypothetical protein [Blastocatellia bacterium]